MVEQRLIRNEPILLSDDLEEVRDAKVIVCGTSKTGKTSIIRAFLQGQSLNYNHYPAQTQLVSDFKKEMTVCDGDGNPSRLILNLWDVGGGHHLFELAHLFMS